MKEHPILITKPLAEQGESLGILFIAGIGSNPPQYLAIDKVTVADWGGTSIVSGFRLDLSTPVVKFPNTTPWLFIQRTLIDAVLREDFQRDMLIQEHTQLCRRIEQSRALEKEMPLSKEETGIPVEEPADSTGQYL